MLVQSKRFTIAEYHRLEEMAFFNGDRDVKGTLYAEVGIEHYWIFNLIDNRLEAYSEPYLDAQGNGTYAQRKYVLSHQAIALPCFDNLAIELSKIFPASP